MKLPSIDQLLHGALRTLVRFPLVLLVAVIGTIAGIVLIDRQESEPTMMFNILFGAILGIPLLFSLAVSAEKRGWTVPATIIVQLAGVLLLAAYAMTVPSSPEEIRGGHVQRLLLLAVALHLFAAVAPFFAKGELNGFWHYNKSLLFRILGAALYSQVLYFGLTIAMLAVNQLFSLDIPPKRYAELWVFTFGILNTWLFLAGVPEDLKGLDSQAEYPKSLRLFSQYVLVPLACIYVCLLYVYIGKIVVTWEWPQGWVSALILGFAAAGLLLFLLSYPLQIRRESRWVSLAPRAFFFAMIPAVIVLPLAVWRRVSEYGITEGRYVGLAVSAWLAIVVAYFLLSKTRNIKFVPLSLAFLALITAFGPWGMLAVSERSQVERLQLLLEKNSILVNGSVTKAASPVSLGDAKNISSILGYLHEIHGYGAIDRWFTESLFDSSTTPTPSLREPADVATMLGVKFVRMSMGATGSPVSYSMDLSGSSDIAGYDRLFRWYFVSNKSKKKDAASDGVSFEITSALDTLAITYAPQGDAPATLHFDLRPLAQGLLDEYSNQGVSDIPPGRMTLEMASGHMKARVVVRTIQVRRKEEGIEFSMVSVDILYSLMKAK